jgi:1-acyl-sn-glycerol-3-phosphate acyltransferase
VRQIRLAWRLPLLVGLLLGGLATVLLLFPLGGPGFRRAAIGRWSRMLVAACGIEVAYREHPGAAALTSLAGGSFIVSNHISWMDIFIIDSQCPASFVAKAEIAAWPLVGTLVARTGNLFIERGKRHAVHRMIERIVHSLAAGARVAVFPEGTTSDGRRLLPFHANLVEAAVRARAPVVPVGLRIWIPRRTFARDRAHRRDQFVNPCWRAGRTGIRCRCMCWRRSPNRLRAGHRRTGARRAFAVPGAAAGRFAARNLRELRRR